MLRVFLGAALGQQEVVIAAGLAAGILAADGGARRVDGAAALFGIEEAADAAEMLIVLAAHGIGLVALDLGEFGARFLEGKAEMIGQPLDVALLEADHGVGAAIARALRTIVDGHDVISR